AARRGQPVGLPGAGVLLPRDLDGDPPLWIGLVDLAAAAPACRLLLPEQRAGARPMDTHPARRGHGEYRQPLDLVDEPALPGRAAVHRSQAEELSGRTDLHRLRGAV